MSQTPPSEFALGRTPVVADDPVVLLRRVGIIAILAVLLGFAMQGLILAAKLASGGVFPGHATLVGLAQGVTWSFLVCLGVAIGVSLGKARTLLAGIVAAIFAPTAIAAAKASQKFMASLIGAADQPSPLPLATIGFVKALEYGILAWLLARLVQKQHGRAGRYLATGIAVALPFGALVSAMTWRAGIAAGAAPAMPQMVGTVVNEVGFPIGCALIIYVGQLVGRSMTPPAVR